MRDALSGAGRSMRARGRALRGLFAGPAAGARVAFATRSLAARAAAWLLVAALAACAGPSSLVGRWRSPDASGYRIGKVLVIVAVTDSTSRRVVEDAMVAALGARAVEAEPSYARLPAEGPSSEPELARAIDAARADSVLLVRAGEVSSETVVAPGAVFGPPPIGPAGFYPYYRGIWVPVYVPPTVYTVKAVSSETRLFEARSRALKWSGSARTDLTGTKLSELAGQYASLIIDALAADGLIRTASAR